MIRSEKQYQVAKKQLASLKESLGRKSQTTAPEALLRAARGQTSELAAEVDKEIKKYEQTSDYRCAVCEGAGGGSG